MDLCIDYSEVLPVKKYCGVPDPPCLSKIGVILVGIMLTLPLS